MKKILIFIGALFLVNAIWSQNVEWVNLDVRGHLSLDSEGNSVRSGGFVDTVDFDPQSYTLNIGAGSLSSFVYKIDDDGELIWAKKTMQGGENYSTGLSIDEDNNIYVLGQMRYTNTYDADPDTSDYWISGDSATHNIYVQKLDENGNFEWAVSLLDTTNSFYSPLPYDIAVGNDGVYISGWFSGTVDFDPSDSGSYVLQALSSAPFNRSFLLKLSLDGEFEWVKQLPTNIRNIICTDGYVMIGAGYTFDVDVSFDTANSQAIIPATPGQGSDAFIVQYDANGNFIWAETIGGTNNDGLADLAIDQDDKIYILGTFKGSFDADNGIGVDNISVHGTDPDSSDIFIQKRELDGTYLWTKGYGGLGVDRPRSIAVNDESSIFMTGTGYNGGVLGTDNIMAEVFFLQQLNTDGSYNWHRILPETSAPYALHELSVFGDRDLYLTGWFNIDSNDIYSFAHQYPLPFQIDPASHCVKFKFNTLGLEPDKKIFHDFTIFPNPSTNNFTVINEEQQLIRIDVYNFMGAIVYSSISSEAHIQISTDSWSSGAYLVKIIDNQNHMKTKKLLKR